jgi:hypothetical protein
MYIKPRSIDIVFIGFYCALGPGEMVKGKTSNSVSVVRSHPLSLLTVREAATLLKVAPHTLNKWRVSGSGPRFIRVGHCVRYRVSDLESYLDDQTKRSTSEP